MSTPGLVDTMYLLDSDTLIFLSKGQLDIQLRIKQAGLSNCFISEVSLAELYVGVYKRVNKKLEPALKFLEDKLEIVPVSPAIRTYTKLRALLESQGNRLPDFDLLIAATAIAGGYTLVTHNTRHFSRIPGLRLEDWLPEF